MSTAVRDDHFVLITDFSDVGAALDLLADRNNYAKPLQARPPKYTEASLSDPASRLYFERLVSSVDFEFPPVPDELDVAAIEGRRHEKHLHHVPADWRR